MLTIWDLYEYIETKKLKKADISSAYAFPVCRPDRGQITKLIKSRQFDIKMTPLVTTLKNRFEVIQGQSRPEIPERVNFRLYPCQIIRQNKALEKNLKFTVQDWSFLFWQNRLRHLWNCKSAFFFVFCVKQILRSGYFVRIIQIKTFSQCF